MQQRVNVVLCLMEFDWVIQGASRDEMAVCH